MLKQYVKTAFIKNIQPYDITKRCEEVCNRLVQRSDQKWGRRTEPIEKKKMVTINNLKSMDGEMIETMNYLYVIEMKRK